MDLESSFQNKLTLELMSNTVTTSLWLLIPSLTLATPYFAFIHSGTSRLYRIHVYLAFFFSIFLCLHKIISSKNKDRHGWNKNISIKKEIVHVDKTYCLYRFTSLISITPVCAVRKSEDLGS